MTFFKEVNLPYPLANSDALEEVYSKKISPDAWNYYTASLTEDLHRLLNPQLISAFQSVGISPLCLIAIERNPVGISYIHRDVTPKNNQWVEAAFTINWEITPCNTTWNWYDTTGVSEGPLPPPYTSLYHTALFYGVHARPERTKDSAGFQQLYSYNSKFNQATLYRIDLAHQVSYNTGTASRRRNIGIRFSIDDISTWQQALEIFQVFST
jgi:hypothetical protein